MVTANNIITINGQTSGTSVKCDGNEEQAPDGNIHEFITSTDTEDILDVIGEFGPWQRKIFLLIFVASMIVPMQNLAIVFFAPTTDFWCLSSPEDVNSTSLWKVANESETLQNECYTYGETEIPCEKWGYDTSYFGETIVSKWNLVCDREWLIAAIQSLFMAGMITSVSICGHLSDRFGRRPIMLTGITLLLVMGIISAMTSNLIVFMISRYFLAIGNSAFQASTLVIMVEMLGPAHRSAMGMAYCFSWCFGYVALTAVAWLCRSWVYIQLALSLPCLLLCSYYWILPESPRWLLALGKMEEATKVVKAAVKSNKLPDDNLHIRLKKLRDMIIKEQSNTTEPQKKATMFDLVKTPKMRKKTLIVILICFSNDLIYYGLSLNTRQFAFNIFISFFLSGIVEFPSNIACYFALKFFGKIKVACASLSIAGIASVIMIFISKDMIWQRIILLTIGKFGIAASYSLALIIATEVFPTTTRSAGVSLSRFASHLGALISPLILEVGGKGDINFAYIILSIFAFLSCITVLMLPETGGMKMPDTIKEAESFGRKRVRILMKKKNEKNKS